MPRFIYSPDILDVLTQIEGEAWRVQQDRWNGSNVAAFLDEYNKLQEYLAGHPEDAGENVEWGKLNPPQGDYAIYGAGGYNRYFVLARTGEILFSRHHATPEKIQQAEELGFSLG